MMSDKQFANVGLPKKGRRTRFSKHPALKGGAGRGKNCVELGGHTGEGKQGVYDRKIGKGFGVFLNKA